MTTPSSPVQRLRRACTCRGGVLICSWLLVYSWLGVFFRSCLFQFVELDLRPRTAITTTNTDNRQHQTTVAGIGIVVGSSIQRPSGIPRKPLISSTAYPSGIEARPLQCTGNIRPPPPKAARLFSCHLHSSIRGFTAQILHIDPIEAHV